MTMLSRRAGWVVGRAQATQFCSIALVVIALASEARCAEVPTREKIAQGQELFAREWVANDPNCHGGDGLGPVYNDTSCIGCHNLGGPGGGGPASKNVELITLTVRRGSKPDDPEVLAEYHPGFRKASSLILHHFGTDPEYRLWRLTSVEGVEFSELAAEGGQEELAVIRSVVTGRSLPSTDGRRLLEPRRFTRTPSRPLVRGRGLLGEVSTLSQRNPPPLFGAGLIDSIPSDILRETALEQQRSKQAIAGRPSSLEPGRIGRFGWKAQVATLDEFVRSACANELGLQNPGHPQSESPLIDAPKSKVMDLTSEECDALVAYVGQLSAPRLRGSGAIEERPFVKDGKALFAKIGCADCHAPKLGAVHGIYSDLLLHDMGEDLVDGASYYGIPTTERTSSAARSSEWRTPPLWGFRDSAPYLHDGRATNLDQAVVFHGGQARASARQYFELKPTERQVLLSFLNSLPAPAPNQSR